MDQHVNVSDKLRATKAYLQSVEETEGSTAKIQYIRCPHDYMDIGCKTASGTAVD